MNASTTDPPEPPRRRLSLSLRGLILLILVLGCVMGWEARRASLQRHAVAAIERLRGSVTYDWEYDGDDLAKKPHSTPPGLSWLRRLLGDEYFQDVAQVTLPAKVLPPPEAGESDETHTTRHILDDQLACLDGLDRIECLRLQWGHLEPEGLARLARLGRLKNLTLLIDPLDADGLAYLGRLSELERLSISIESGDAGDLAFLDRLPKLRSLQILSSPVTDAGLAYIGRRDQLNSLSVDGSELTDAGLTHLEGLKALEYLSLDFASGITDAGLVHLERLTEIRALHLSGTPITDAGVEHIHKLPKLRILTISKERVRNRAIEDLQGSRPGLKIRLSSPPSDGGESPFERLR
jgi:hypothetical protein